MNNESDIDNIIALLEFLEEKDNNKNNKEKDEKEENKIIISEFLNKLLTENNLFKKEEFFSEVSKEENLKILLLLKLNEKGILQKHDTEEFYNNIKELMGNIKKDIDGEINKKNLDEFINIPESIIKRRLSLLNLIYDNFNSEEEYKNLKKLMKE